MNSICSDLSGDPVRYAGQCSGSGLLTPGSGLPQPLKMVADFPKDLREPIKIARRRVCNLMEGADAIMLGIIKINCTSRKTITMY